MSVVSKDESGKPCISNKVLEKIGKTATAIANIPTKDSTYSGHIALGIAESEETARRFCNDPSLLEYTGEGLWAIGVESDLKELGLTLEEYLKCIGDKLVKIEAGDKYSKLANGLNRGMQISNIGGRTVIVIPVPASREVVLFKDDAYERKSGLGLRKIGIGRVLELSRELAE